MRTPEDERKHPNLYLGEYPMRHFHDRTEAGRLLASRLLGYAQLPEVKVLALPRGGVPVAFEIAIALQVPLDVLVVRKLGVPGQRELAMGAIAADRCLLNSDIIRELGISNANIQAVVEQEWQELTRREQRYRGTQPPIAVQGCSVIVVDDGLATGATMRVAVAALQQQQPQRLIVAVPVGSGLACQMLAQEVDELHCPYRPEPFHAVGSTYDCFPQTSDIEVCHLLEQANQPWGWPETTGPARSTTPPLVHPY